MFVVVGSPVAVRGPDEHTAPGGLAARVAIVAARAGATVQLVGKLGDDDVGDAVLLGLATAGVGHVALVRDAANPTPITTWHPQPGSDDPLGEPAELAEPHPTPAGLALEPADVDLALKYLTDYRVIAVIEPQGQGVTAVVVESAAYVGATLVAVTSQGGGAGLPESAIVVEEPQDTDPDGGFATFVGGLAAAIDGGASPADAFRELGAALGVVPVADS